MQSFFINFSSYRVILFLSLNGNSLFQKKDYVFGTIVDIKIYGESKKLASKASEEILSNFNKASSICFILGGKA